MGHFTDVAWCRDTAKADSKPKQESTSEEHVHVDRRSLDTCTNYDDGSTSEHPCTTTKIIIDRSGEDNRWNGPNIVDGKYYSS
jgi:hypothetical protein